LKSYQHKLIILGVTMSDIVQVFSQIVHIISKMNI